jgi:hypothetical protein
MYQIQAGNHWLDAAGGPLCPEDGRAVLPHDLRPQEEVELTLAVRTPKQPGMYLLELDLLQNGVSWFKDQGSATDTVRMRVSDRALSGHLPDEGSRTSCTEAMRAQPCSRRRCTAQITWMRPTYHLEASARVPILVHVKNLSDIAWPARHHDGTPHQIFLGNHWLDQQGVTLVVDDGRAALPAHLGPLEEVAIPLVIQAPATPGRYRLELDLVQDGIAWFKALGSETDVVDIVVCPGPVAGTAQASGEGPVLAGLTTH